MKKEELYKRGENNIEDAVFIRDLVIPTAQQARRWNIVVHEAYVVTELLIKGMMCLSGYEPAHKHELDKLIDRFSEILLNINTNEPLPYIYSIHTSEGQSYSIHIIGEMVRLILKINNTYTVLGQAHKPTSTEELLTLRLEIEDKALRLRTKGKIIISTSQAPSGPVKAQRRFTRKPDPARIKQLQDAVKKLREDREPARYSERSYSESEALNAVSLMNTAFEASTAFINIDPRPLQIKP